METAIHSKNMFDIFLPKNKYLPTSKVTTATNVNIKEKHEADLKKEIKKLQVLNFNSLQYNKPRF